MGDIVVLIVQLCSAAYIIYKTTQAVISFADGLAHIYRLGSVISNYMGQYELIYVTLYYGTAFVMVIQAFYGAMTIWDMIAAREKGVEAEGFFGTAVSFMDCLKGLTLGMVVAIATYYSAYSIGETVDNLIGWFDQWDDKKFNEGDDKRTGNPDIAGTSILTDLQYHGITVIYSWFVFTFIILGANFMAFEFMGFKRLEGCNLDDVNESYYEPVRPLIASEVDLPSCKAAVKAIFRLADLDGSHTISRCENAKFLYGIGNTSEYALEYSEIKILPYLYDMCAKKFPVMTPPTIDDGKSH